MGLLGSLSRPLSRYKQSWSKMPRSLPSSIPQPVLWQTQSPRGQTNLAVPGTPIPNQTRLWTHGQGQEVPRPRSFGGTANPARGAVSGWLRGDCRGKQRQGGKGGAREGCISGCQSGCLERSRGGSPCLWCPAPWGRREGRGGETGGESGPSLGSWCPGKRGWGLCRTAILASSRPAWNAGGRVARKAPQKGQGESPGPDARKPLGDDASPHDLRLLGALLPPAPLPNPHPLRRTPPPTPGAAALSGPCPGLGSSPPEVDPAQRGGGLRKPFLGILPPFPSLQL